jgi:hypothetical protein
MFQVFFPKNFQFRHCKFSFSADPVILDLKLQLTLLMGKRGRDHQVHEPSYHEPFLENFSEDTHRRYGNIQKKDKNSLKGQ